MYRSSFIVVLCLLLVVFLFALDLLPAGSATHTSAQDARAKPINEGSKVFDYGKLDSISEKQQEQLMRSTQKNIQSLQASGKIARRFGAVKNLSLMWPTKKAPWVKDFNIGQIPYYVDQNPDFPGFVSDWNCGTRTYDQPNGYNHKGTDIVSFPFPWKRLENDEVFAVAAAAGTIVLKEDGNPDHNCTRGNFPLNTIHILHEDGSMGWYLHLKKGSLTKKEVGDKVSAGEYLGVVGSSGSSSVPHLHFELYDADGNLQDPYAGPCNTMNDFSWWEQQEPYRNSQINRLMTGSALSQYPACPMPEITNEKTIYRPLDALVTTAFYRDIQNGQTTNFSIIKPNGSTFSQWSFTSQNTANASYRFANWQLGAAAPRGVWKYKAEYNGQSYEVPFVVTRAPFDFDGDNKTDLAVYRGQCPDGGDTSDPLGKCVRDWWTLRSSDEGVLGLSFGFGFPRVTPADFTGDGKTDIAFFDVDENQGPSFTWHVLRSEDNSYFSFPFGGLDDIPAPGDFDGDGKSDPAVFRPSTGTWYLIRSSDQQVQTVQFGAAGDQPTVADFDGDGRDDIAVFRPSSGEWWQLRSTEGVIGFQFGSGSDLAVPGDYTGDGKADIAFFRPSEGNWYVLRSEDSSFYAFPWGLESDVPAPGDYDGDGSIDPAVFRPADSTWYILGSTSGIQTVPFGLQSDIPLPSAYVRSGNNLQRPS